MKTQQGDYIECTCCPKRIEILVGTKIDMAGTVSYPEGHRSDCQHRRNPFYAQRNGERIVRREAEVKLM